jgi:CRISPR-associated protein Csx10
VKHLSLQVMANSPLAIRSDHAEGSASTTHTIPGATLLGSLAAAHRLLRPTQEAEFAAFFLNEEVSFPYLYPALFATDTLLNAGSPVMPFPKTTQTCKRFSGFQPLPKEETDEERHGVRDALLDWAVFSLLDLEKGKHSTSTLLKPLEAQKYCSCGQVMDHESGYYRRTKDRPPRRAKAQLHTRLQTRTGINRDWGIVEESILYNHEVFDEGMRFWGEVILPDALFDDFTAFLAEADEEGLIRIGTGRTRGMGDVTVNANPLVREDFAQFEARLEDFNTKLIARLNQDDAPVNDKYRHQYYFALTLYTPAILYDPFLRACKTIDGKLLAALLSDLVTIPDKITFIQIYQASSIQRVTGWNELWGTPRTNDYAMETGSTFLFTCAHKPDQKLLQALYQLEETGIGRRCAEGFGRISISDPFHLESDIVRLEGEQA